MGLSFVVLIGAVIFTMISLDDSLVGDVQRWFESRLVFDVNVNTNPSNVIEEAMWEGLETKLDRMEDKLDSIENKIDNLPVISMTNTTIETP